MPGIAHVLAVQMTLPPMLRDLAERLALAVRPAVDNVIVCDRVDSTQSCALRLIDQAEAEELTLPTTLIVAGRQQDGLGRRGRRWQSPDGGLYMTWLAAGLDPPLVAALPMISAAAVWVAVTRLGVDGAAIKWPNDIVVDRRKLAGILIHARHGASTWAAVGIGINLDRTPALTGQAAATAVSDHVHDRDGHAWIEELVRITVEELSAGLLDPTASVAVWKTRLAHAPGDELTVRLADGEELAGRYAGVTDQGHLRLEADGAERVISTGDVIE